eukprot:1289290-Pyramimonas_sp.AAC.1
MAPKRRAPAGAVVAAGGGAGVDRLKEKTSALKKDRDFWKEKALGPKRFVAVVAKKSEQNKRARKVFHRCQAAVGRRLHRGRADQIDAARQAAAHHGVAR